MGFRSMVTGTWLALATCASAASAGLLSAPEPLGNVVLTDKPADAHWVWIGDFQDGNYGRSILYNADTGVVLGTVDIGWEGIKLDVPATGNEIYNLAMFMSRGFRGERTDVITAYDRHTLNPLREIIVPPKGIKGWPDPNHTALSDDGRFLFMQFLTPASSIGVADVKAGKYIGEIETSGCAHVMAAGNRRFFTLCGDGSILAITLTDQGKEASRNRYSHFFDADKDPVHGSGTRSGNIWYFASWYGQIHAVDVGGTEPKFLPLWSVAQREGASTWVPGAFMQPVAVHTGKGRLYIAMQLSDLKPKGGGTDFHAKAGSETWVFDLASKRRIKQIVMKYPVTHLAVSQDPNALLYCNGMWNAAVTVYEESSGRPLREISIPTFPTLIQPVN